MFKSHRKRFAHKVRTGCITCKRRRVKCDETKPACLRCQRADQECLGYDIPKAKYFDYVPPQGYQRFENTTLQEGNENELALTLSPTVSALSSVFQNEGELQAFDMYMLRTAPMLATYGPQIGSIYTTIIPQWILRSPALKHITIAVALTQYSGSKKSGNCDLALISQAMSHYNKAIYDVIYGSPPKVCVLLTAFLAWCIEMMGDNFEAATKHVNGMKTILQDIEMRGVNEEEKPTLKLIQTDVKRASELAEGFLLITQQNAEQKSEGPIIDSNLGALRAARESLAQHLNTYARSQRRYDDMCELRACLHLWINTMRRWDEILPLTPNRNALRVLLLLAVSLLPADEAAGFSHSLNTSVVEHALQIVSELRCIKTLNDDAMKELNETLKMILVYIIRYYHEADYQEQAAGMLSVLSIEDG